MIQFDNAMKETYTRSTRLTIDYGAYNDRNEGKIGINLYSLITPWEDWCKL